LRRKLNSLKDAEFPWMREVTKNAPQQAIKNLGTAFKNYFADLKKPKRRRRFHYPQFKKKGKHDSFRADNGPDKDHPNAVEVDDKRVKLPRRRSGSGTLCESNNERITQQSVPQSN
jgi:putative transposase